MEKISTKELIKNAFLALLKPHKAFREIPKEGKLDYKKIIPLTFIWGAIFIILSFAFAQRTLIFQWNHWKFTLIFQAIYSFLLWFGGSILFFLLAKIFRKRVNLDRIEIGVFYIWIVWAIMPFFDLPHLLFKIPMWTIWGRGAHISWFITFPIFSILTFFFLKDILNFKNKEVTFTGVFSLFLPFVGRFILEDIPIFLDRILKLFFKKPAGFVSCALFANIFCLLLAIFLKLAFEKRIPFKNFIFGLVLLSFCFFSFWIWMTYFTSLFNFPTGGKTFSTIFFHKTNDFVKGRSRWTASYTWTSSDKESGTIQHPASGAENDNNDSYWSDTYSSGAFDFIPANVTVVELRVRVHFTSATANKQSGAGPKAQGCWQVGTSTTYYCSNWIENLNGASTQTFTISSSSIRTYVANGDGAAAGSSEWNSLVSNLQSSGENIIVHTWTQGDGDGNSENGDKVAFDEVYAEVYYTGGDFTQHTYRWYVNTDAIQPTDPWPSGTTDLAENTPITTSDSPPESGDVLRLRINVKGAMTSGTQAFKLQYGEGSDCSSISTWTDVDGLSGSGIWRGYNNPTPSDGTTITSTLLSNSTKAGTYEEANNSANNPNSATASDYTEYDWVIQDNGAPANTTYCFRMVESGGAVFDAYTNYPKLTTNPGGISVSGNAYENETSTPLSICNGSTNAISLRVGGTTYGPVPCSSSDGSFTITGISQPSAGDPMILWIDNQTPKATTITKYSGSGNVTGLEIRKDRLMIMSNYGSVTNSDLDTWDSSNDTDIIYNVSSNNLTLADGYKLIVNTGVTYQPGGTITTSPSANSSTTDGDILVQSTATLNMESYPLSIGGDFTNSGTFTLSSGQTTTFTATATGHTISHGTATFENITFNGTGGGWSFASSTTINQDLTMTAGTLSGTQNITVNGGDVTGNGTINLTGGTFTLDGTGNFGGDTNWTFYNLTFGNGTGTETATKTGTNQITITNVLTISSNQTLSAVDDTWVLSGTGTPFVVNGTFNPDWSTVHYTGNGATNIAGVNYATLKIGTSNNANITYTALGNITAYQEVNIQSAGSGYTNTFNMQGYNLVVGDPNYSNSGDIIVPVRAAFVQSASGTTIVRSNWWGAVNNAYLGGAGSTTFYNLQIGYTNDNYPVFAYLAGDITVLNDLTITLAGVNNHILDVTTSNYQITVGGNWTNNDTFTCRQGTVVFNATTTGKTISDGGDPFYDIVFNGSGGGWLYKDGSSTAPNSTTVQAGTATFLNAKTGTVSVTGGTLNVDWYLATHLVDAINTSTNIDTGDNDITISENSSTPYSTVFRYNGGWGSGATSQTTGTDSTGLNPQPENTGAIRIREYTMTNSSQCPGSGCTLYKYNLQVNWQANYGEYDYYQGYGQKYLTSCLSGSSSSCGDDTSADDSIGVNWYRETPSTQNGTKPYDGLNEPPYHGTWYVGMISALEVSISDYDIDFGTIEPGSLPTNQQNTITVQTGASHGYVIYTSTIQQMTHTLYPTVTIPNWTGTNSSPTIWTTGEGFGYSTDDYTLTGGTPDRFSGPKYAGFSQTGPGDPVADRDGPTTSSDGQNTITYRLGVSQTQPAGSYSTTVLFVVVPEY